MLSEKNKKKIADKIAEKQAEAEKLKSLQTKFDAMDNYYMSQKEKMLEEVENAHSKEDRLKFQHEAKLYESMANNAWNNAASLGNDIANIEKSIEELKSRLNKKEAR